MAGEEEEEEEEVGVWRVRSGPHRSLKGPKERARIKNGRIHFEKKKKKRWWNR